MSLARAIEAAEQGCRLERREALALLTEAELTTLGRLALAARRRINPPNRVTYCVDRNINTSNICLSACRFCAFFRPPGHPEGYRLGRRELAQKIQETLELGGTQILMQGGLDPEIGLEETCRTIAYIKDNFSIHVHALSPPEVVHMAQMAGLSIAETLGRLMEAGLDSMPGGGAEILVERVRALISPGKCSAQQWLEVMATAHRLGLNTTATMMFGHIETTEERLEHLFSLRRVQDQSLAAGRGRFTAFIPWTFQPGNTALAEVTPATAVEYLRMLAVSRLVLDNFEHLQASWVTQGAKIAQVSLSFGADDLGSTMIEENVVAAAGVSHRLDAAELQRLAGDMGYQACQRNTFYQLV